jgi:murein DD-endopeptidase
LPDQTDSFVSDLLEREYEHGGRGPDKYDCYGLAIEIYRRRGISLPEVHEINDRELIHAKIDHYASCFVKIDNPVPFCIVTFMIVAPYTTHIGVVLSDTYRFIHIRRSSRVTIERLNSILWNRRITGYYQWKS